MRWCAFLAGDHDELPYAELAAIMETYDEDAVCRESDGRLIRFDSRSLPWNRLAMTRYVIREEFHGSVGDADDLDITITGRYAVRCTVVAGDADSGALERQIGEAVSSENNCVDLDNPEEIVRGFVVGDTLVAGRQVFAYDPGSFQKRSNQNRRYSSPISLHPRLARVLVNLAQVRESERVCDPVCGTGGILLEAGMMGMEPVGGDIDAEMVAGCRANLAMFACDAELYECSMQELPENTEMVDAVVADLPYGRASRKDGENFAEKFLESAKDLTNGRVVFMLDRPTVAGYEHVYEVYVHRSLSRYIYCVSMGDG